MLGRLQMSVSQCLEEFVAFTPLAFERKRHVVRLKTLGIDSIFEAAALERAVKDLLQRYGLDPEELLQAPPGATCKV